MSENLQGDMILLRAATLSDVEARVLLGNHPEVLRMFGMSADKIGPITVEAATRWVQSLIDHPCAWIIQFEGSAIGELRLDKIDFQDRRASMALGIYNPTLLSRGLGSEAINLALRFAFTALGLHRIGVRVIAYNSRAIRAYEKCGFVIEGREREAGFVDGVWHDDVMMGIIDRAFFQRDTGQAQHD